MSERRQKRRRVEGKADRDFDDGDEEYTPESETDNSDSGSSSEDEEVSESDSDSEVSEEEVYTDNDDDAEMSEEDEDDGDGKAEKQEKKKIKRANKNNKKSKVLSSSPLSLSVSTEEKTNEKDIDADTQRQLAQLKKIRAGAPKMTKLTRRLRFSESDVSELESVLQQQKSERAADLQKRRDIATAKAVAAVVGSGDTKSSATPLALAPPKFWSEIRGRLISRFAGYSDVTFAFLSALAQDARYPELTTQKMLCVPVDLPVPILYLMERRFDDCGDESKITPDMFIVHPKFTQLADRLPALVLRAKEGGFRYVPISVTLIARDAADLPIGQSAHANVALLDVVDGKTVYYFEPHGALAFIPGRRSFSADGDEDGSEVKTLLSARWNQLGVAVTNQLSAVLPESKQLHFVPPKVLVGPQVKETRSNHHQQLVFIGTKVHL
jgi:hypothetical protein